MNGRVKQYFVLALLLIIPVAALVFYACGDDGASSNTEFEPGVYGGIYKITTSPYDDGLKVDTLLFTFQPNGTFFMRRDTVYLGNDTLVDQQQRFCEVTGEYELITYTDSAVIDITYMYPQTCIADEIPGARYRYFTAGGTIVFTGYDQTYYRRIELWERQESQ